ncbi:MAG: T9SS type A sorting domain-containing protein [Melioribacteraceae bacterium]|nr:MAG: T9SS type A sorting domain-containing protein [Melioribacteraceae bacterium]
MRKLFLAILLVSLFHGINAQTLYLEENFNFTGLLTNNGWTAHSGGGTNPVSTSTGLTFTDYAMSGIGNAASLSNTGEDVNRSFTSINSGNIYISFLINVGDAPNGYFLHLRSSTSHYSRVWVTEDGTGDFELGLSKFSEAESYTDNNYSFGTTYLIVIKYTFNNTTSDDDVVTMYVFADGADFSSEPVTSTLGPLGVGTADFSSFENISLRQYTSTQDIIIDGIRVSDSWSQAPLPVELTKFEAEYANNSVQLNWETATETNNAGFEVQRQNSELGTQNSEWEVLTFIPGHGTTNSPKYYSYTDNDLPDLDKVFYRLRQIDNDGTDAYSKTVEVDLGGVTSVEDEMQFEFALEQNYPNPFNPVTTINFTLPSVGTTHELSLQAKLTVYNLLGQEVHTLVNEVKSAGSYQIQFDASDLPSGIYFYSLTYGNHNQTRKLALLK